MRDIKTTHNIVEVVDLELLVDEYLEELIQAEAAKLLRHSELCKLIVNLVCNCYAEGVRQDIKGTVTQLTHDALMTVDCRENAPCVS